jgi:hypothetical protein
MLRSETFCGTTRKPLKNILMHTGPNNILHFFSSRFHCWKTVFFIFERVKVIIITFFEKNA